MDKLFFINNLEGELRNSGWHLVEENKKSRLYCDDKGSSLGITFPLEPGELEEKIGFYTYPAIKTLSIGYEYSRDGDSGGCSDMGYYKNGLVISKISSKT